MGILTDESRVHTSVVPVLANTFARLHMFCSVKYWAESKIGRGLLLLALLYQCSFADPKDTQEKTRKSSPGLQSGQRVCDVLESWVCLVKIWWFSEILLETDASGSICKTLPTHAKLFKQAIASNWSNSCDQCLV